MAGLVYKEIQGLAEGAVDWAIKSFEKALEIEPTDVQSLLELAKLEQNRGDGSKARGLLERAKALKPDFLEVRFELGRLYYNQGEFDGAQEEFLAGLQIFPNHSNSLYSLALVYEREGQKGQALNLLRAVEQLNPDNSHIKEKIRQLTSAEDSQSAPEPEVLTEEENDSAELE